MMEGQATWLMSEYAARRLANCSWVTRLLPPAWPLSAAYPYANLVETSRGRSRQEFEYELLDTGVFDQDRYFDVFVEYAKELPEDILIQITVHNRGPEAAELHVLPTLWFRNQWSWQSVTDRPTLQQSPGNPGWTVVRAVHAQLGERHLFCGGEVPLLSPRTKPTRSASSVCPIGLRMSRTASTTTSSTARKGP